MARYIDLDKAIERLKASPAFPNFGTDGYFLLDVVEDLLKQQPTADVVPRAEFDQLLISATTDIPISMVTLFKVRTEHPLFKAIETEVAREIFEGLRTSGLTEWRYPIIGELKQKYGLKQPFAELEQKLTEGGERNGGCKMD